MQGWLNYKKKMYRFVFCLVMSHCSFFCSELLRDSSYVRINAPKLSGIALSDRWSALYLGVPLQVARNLVVLAREDDGNFLCIADNEMLRNYIVALVLRLPASDQPRNFNIEFTMIVNSDTYRQLDCCPRFQS